MEGKTYKTSDYVGGILPFLNPEDELVIDSGGEHILYKGNVFSKLIISSVKFSEQDQVSLNGVEVKEIAIYRSFGLNSIYITNNSVVGSVLIKESGDISLFIQNSNVNDARFDRITGNVTTEFSSDKFDDKNINSININDWSYSGIERYEMKIVIMNKKVNSVAVDTCHSINLGIHHSKINSVSIFKTGERSKVSTIAAEILSFYVVRKKENLDEYIRFDSLEMIGGSVKIMNVNGVNINNVSIKHIEWDKSLLEFNSINISDLGIYGSLIDNIKFFLVKIKRAEFGIYGSIEKIDFIGCSPVDANQVKFFPNNNLSAIATGWNKLRIGAERVGDHYNARRLRAKYLSAQLRYLWAHERENWKEIFILGLSKYSNYFGQNWVRALLEIIVVAALYLGIGYWVFEPETISGFPSLFNPTGAFKEIWPGYIPSFWSTLSLFLIRLVLAFLIFQFIKAFRKYAE